MAKIKRRVETEVLTVGGVEEPTVVVSGIPLTAEVGDQITPSVNVKRANGITPVAGADVDFYADDTSGTMAIGERQQTDSNGDATASESYYVSTAEAGSGVTFTIVIRSTSVI